jgi:hypothetical protein
VETDEDLENEIPDYEPTIRGHQQLNQTEADETLDEQFTRSKRNHTKTIDIVEEVQKNYNKNPRPYKLGGLYCLWYDKNDNPRIVIGPDYTYSLI